MEDIKTEYINANTKYTLTITDSWHRGHQIIEWDERSIRFKAMEKDIKKAKKWLDNLNEKGLDMEVAEEPKG